MPESNASVNEWSPGKKQAFRFSFIFLFLYILVNPNDVIPYFYFIRRFTRQPFFHLVNWLSDVLFHIHDSLSNSYSTATDTTFNNMVVLFTAVFACIGSVIWFLLDNRSPNYNRLRDLLFVILRYYLAITWIAYGTLKVVRFQFPELTPINLFHNIGDSLPRELAWNFMGYSAGLNYFIGTAEYGIGLLLFFRRTSTFGNLIGIGALVNIVAFNYCFDDNVKLLSTMLMVMSLFLLSKDIKQLIDFFFRGQVRSVEKTRLYNVDAKGREIFFHLLKYGLIVFVIVYDLIVFSARARQLGYIGKKPPLYGAYTVKSFVLNNDTLKPLTTDTARWNKLLVSSAAGKAAVTLMNNEMRYFVINTDTAKKTIRLTSKTDTANKYLFHYDLKDSLLSIYGKHHDNLLYIQLKQVNLNKLPLLDPE